MHPEPLAGELSLAPRPDLVRTVRLVVTAAARRAGVHEDLLDEVRLAVGEAAAGAVLRHDGAACDDPVLVRWQQSRDAFGVEVSDAVPALRHGDAPLTPEGADTGLSPDDDLSLAVVAGLVALDVERAAAGRTVRMTWSLGTDTDAAADTGGERRSPADLG